jgi:hypothetical protein
MAANTSVAAIISMSTKRAVSLLQMPRGQLPDGKVALIEPDWVGKLAGFTLLFEALVLMLAQQMPFAAVARIVGESWYRVHAICRHYVECALAQADLSALTSVAIDETSYRRGHSSAQKQFGSTCLANVRDCIRAIVAEIFAVDSARTRRRPRALRDGIHAGKS